MITKAKRMRRAVGLSAGVVLVAASGGARTSATEMGAGGEVAGAGDSAAPAVDFEVALISEGANNDQSFSNSVYDGAVRAAEELGLEVEFVGSLLTPDDFLRQGTSFASEGVDLLMFIHGGMAAQARQVAQRFPDTEVCVGPYEPTEEELSSDPENLCYWDVEQQEGSFMAGALVAGMEGVDHIGSINAFEFGAITRQAEGFQLGARCVNPDIQFSQTYVDTWTDTAKAKAAAQSMISQGVDVILAATDSAVVGIYEAAREADTPVYVIPSYYDAYDQAPDVILTSILHNLDGAMYDLISAAATTGLEPNAVLHYDFANGGVGELADFRENASVVGEENIERWNTEIVERVRSGEITVPDEVSGDPPLGLRGAGEETDLASIGC